MTEQKLCTHAQKVVTLSPPSSLQQIAKLGNTPYFLSKTLNSWFIISKSLSVQTLPYLRLVDDVILRSFCSVVFFCFLFSSFERHRLPAKAASRRNRLFPIQPFSIVLFFLISASVRQVHGIHVFVSAKLMHEPYLLLFHYNGTFPQLPSFPIPEFLKSGFQGRREA